MIAIRGWQHLLLALDLALWVASSAAQVNSSPVGQNEIIEMGTYVVTAPMGNGWNIQKDQVKELVTFLRFMPPTIFSVARYPVPESSRITDTEKLAAMIFDFEEKNMAERGVSRSYTPSGFTRDQLVVSGKKVHAMRYSVTQLGLKAPLNPLIMKYVMYLYMPENWMQSRRVYVFLIGAPQAMDDTSSDPSVEEIDSFIGTFKER